MWKSVGWMVSNLATQEKLDHKRAMGNTEKQSDLCHTITKTFGIASCKPSWKLRVKDDLL